LRSYSFDKGDVVRGLGVIPLALLLAGCYPRVDLSAYGDKGGDDSGIIEEPPADDDGDGFTVEDGDCDDADANISPEATELCDEVDNDCDGEVDEGIETGTWYVDEDGDGFGGDAVESCAQPEGTVAISGDCDDTDPAYHPGATEVCDETIDYNCDGSTGYADADGDAVPACEDCDDRNDEAYPGATEVCDEVDNDCDGTVDEGVQKTYYTDRDGDGYGDPGETAEACDTPTGYVDVAGDCDPLDGEVYPDAPESCNEVDDDCDGDVDEGVLLTWYRDADADGYGEVSETAEACDTPAGYVSDSTDCDDNNGDTYPGASEQCDGEDNDCDGADDTRGYWPLDGDSVDAGPLGLDGTETVITYTTGHVGYGASFGSSTSDIEFPYTELQPTGGLTISFWLRPSDVSSSSWNCMVTQGSSTGYTNGYAVCLHAAALAFCTDDGSTAGNCLEDGGSYSSGTWYHVVVAWDVSSGTRTIYVNGVETATDTGVAPATPVYDAATATLLGADVNVGVDAARYYGMMDEAKVFDCAVSATQAATDYSSNWPF